MRSEVTNVNQICPQITEFKLRGNSIFGDHNLKVIVKLTTAGLKYDGSHLVTTNDISNHFDAEEYRKNGY